MGQCVSAPHTAGESEAYRARWQGGGLGDGLAAYDAQKYDHQGASPVPNYTTTANVGLHRSTDNPPFLHDRPGALVPIDEERSLQGVGSPAKAPPTTTPRPDAPPTGLQPTSWTQGELIGQGAFGSVYLGMDNNTGHLMAVKQVAVGAAAAGASAPKVAEHVRALEAEVQLLQHLHHPNIVRYLGTERTPAALNIFLEYVPGGSIASLLAKFGSFKESVVRVYTKQILLGLEYLHANGIIHRDIKGANILVDNTGLVKLADFGASKKIEDLVTIESGFKSVKGTPYWMAPEVITQSGHGRQADVWSVACTVIEMATGRPPWSQYGSQVSAMFHIAKTKGPPTIPEHLSPACKDFLYLAFNRNAKDRPPASKLLQHPFLADVVCRTVAAPLNNIAAPEVPAAAGAGAGEDVGGAHSVGIPASMREQQRALERRSGEGAGAVAQPQPSSPGAGAGLSPSPTRPQPSLTPGRAAAGPRGNPRMSPLGSHAGRRRQLDLDAAAGAPATAAAAAGAAPPPPQGSRRHSSGLGLDFASPSKRSAVRSSAPVFSAAYGALPQQLPTPRRAGTAPAAVLAGAAPPPPVPPPAAAALPPAALPQIVEATLAVEDPTLLRALRGSSSGAARRSGDASLPSTIALSGSRDGRPTAAPDACAGGSGAAPAPASPRRSSRQSLPAARQSLAATLDVRGSDDRSTSSARSGASAALTGGAPGGPAASASSSQRSEFNPMLEPAWQGSRAASLSDEATSVQPAQSSRPASSAGGGDPAARRSRGSSASLGPIVYTVIEADGQEGVQGLPWDVDPAPGGGGSGAGGGGGWASTRSSGGSVRGGGGGGGGERPPPLQARGSADREVLIAALNAHAQRASAPAFDAGPLSPSKHPQQQQQAATRIPRAPGSPAKAKVQAPPATPSKPALAPGSPAKAPRGAAASYQELHRQQQAQQAQNRGGYGGGGGGGSPSKSAAAHPLRTPRRGAGGGGPPGTPARRPAAAAAAAPAAAGGSPGKRAPPAWV